MGQFVTPSLTPYADVDRSWMVGRVVADFTFHEPTLWVVSFAPDAGVQAECLWRIVRDGRVVLTSKDHGHQFGLPAPVDAVREGGALLVGRAVAAVQLREATADLTIEFADDLRFEIIPDSAGYESWQMWSPAGIRYVATGGGRIGSWKP